MKARPLHDRILVKRIDEGEQKIGGIIIPDTAKEKPQQGKVVAVGTGKVKDDGGRIALDVKAGDTILFGKYSGSGDQARRRGVPDHARRGSPGDPGLVAVPEQHEVPKRSRYRWQSRLSTASSPARQFSAG